MATPVATSEITTVFKRFGWYTSLEEEIYFAQTRPQKRPSGTELPAGAKEEFSI
jgi:hypothetical protein